MNRLKALAYEHPLGFCLSVLFIIAAAFLFPGFPDIDERDHKGWTALMQAADQGDLNKAQYLLQHGAQVDACDNCNWTALMRAASAGHLSIIRLLADDYGASVNIRDKGGYTPLMVAASNNHAEVVRFLAVRGAELNVADDNLGAGPL